MLIVRQWHGGQISKGTLTTEGSLRLSSLQNSAEDGSYPQISPPNPTSPGLMGLMGALSTGEPSPSISRSESPVFFGDPSPKTSVSSSAWSESLGGLTGKSAAWLSSSSHSPSEPSAPPSASAKAGAPSLLAICKACVKQEIKGQALQAWAWEGREFERKFHLGHLSQYSLRIKLQIKLTHSTTISLKVKDHWKDI